MLLSCCVKGSSVVIVRFDPLDLIDDEVPEHLDLLLIGAGHAFVVSHLLLVEGHLHSLGRNCLQVHSPELVEDGALEAIFGRCPEVGVELKEALDQLDELLRGVLELRF